LAQVKMFELEKKKREKGKKSNANQEAF